VAGGGQTGGSKPRGGGGTKGSSASRKGFLLRVPPALLDEIRRWAAQDLRSVNAQIEFLLTEAVRRRRNEP